MTKLSWYQVTYQGKPENSPWGQLWLLEDGRRAELEPQLTPLGTTLEPVDPPENATLTDQVKAYARGHYDTGGWDYVVEAISDDEIIPLLEYLPDDGTILGRSCLTMGEVLENSLLPTVISRWADARNDAF
jgi:hypothetical protein